MKTTNRILSVILALMLCIGMIPMTATKADAAPVSVDYKLWLEGGKVYKSVGESDHGDEITGSALSELGITGSFEDGVYVYTFNNVNFSTTENEAVQMQDLNPVIKLIGDNTVKSGDAVKGTCGIDAESESNDQNLKITGDGSLTVIAGSSSRGEATYGIEVDDTLIIEGVTVKVVVGDSGVENGLPSWGIKSGDHIAIRNSTVIATAGNTAGNYDSAGISVRYGNIEISNSTVIATGAKTKGNSYGIHARANAGETNQGKLTVSNSLIVARGGDCDSSYGIYAADSFDIKTSTVYMLGNKNAVNASPTTSSNMGAMADTAVDGTNASRLTGWKGDGTDDVSSYKYMMLSPVFIKETPIAYPADVGETLSDSSPRYGVVEDINGNEVEGTFEWWDGTEVLDTPDVVQRPVIFTPDDTVNYSGLFDMVDVMAIGYMDTATITGVTVPEIGNSLQSADFQYTIPDGVNYVPGDGMWFESDAPIDTYDQFRDATELRSEHEFKEGKYYTFLAMLHGLDAYRFEENMASVTVNGNDAKYNFVDTTENIEVWYTFYCKEPEVYDFTVTPKTLDFGTVTEGYTDAPAAQTVTVTNTGNQQFALTAVIDSENFVLVGDDVMVLNAGESATFTIQPKNGLAVGTHTAEVTIEAMDIDKKETVTATFTVKAVPIPETDSSQTGDNSNMALMLALLFVSGMGVVATTVYGRKKRTN